MKSSYYIGAAMISCDGHYQYLGNGWLKDSDKSYFKREDVIDNPHCFIAIEARLFKRLFNTTSHRKAM